MNEPPPPGPLVETHQSAGWFVVRVPLLPLESVLAMLGGGGDATGQGLSAGSRQCLLSMIDSPLIREALYVASRTLVDAIPGWMSDPQSKDGRRAETSLCRYLVRAGCRTTPFGLFAGVALGETGEKTRFRIADHMHWRRAVRLDDAQLVALCAALERLPHVREVVHYRPSNTMYEMAGRVRFVAARVTNDVPQHALVAVRSSLPLRRALNVAKDGATRGQIVEEIASTGVPRAEAWTFADELIETGLLVSDLSPRITGVEGLKQLGDQLDALGLLDERHAVSEIGHRLEELAQHEIGVKPSAYQAVDQAVSRITRPAKDIVQVDLRVHATVQLPQHVCEEILRGVDAIRSLGLGTPNPDKVELEKFRERFLERYQAAEVPLAVALDDETGIGFGDSNQRATESSPLLEDLPVLLPAGVATSAPLKELQLKLLETALSEKMMEVVLDDSDIAAFGRGRDEYPETFSAMVCIVATSEAAVNEGRFRVLLTGLEGPSGGRMLARMCGVIDGLETKLRALLRAEEARSPEAIFAEVVHSPGGRLGNVVHRPVLRDYEIPWAGHGAVPDERQIPVEDLLVSVDSKRVMLRSKRFRKEVVPRLTTAHHYLHPMNLTMYKFLCALQMQGSILQPVWWWAALSRARFLPRVRYGRLVLCKARWRLDKADLRSVRSARDEIERLTAWAGVRQLRNLPRHVVFDDSGREMLIDLESALSVNAVARLLSEDGVTLQEVYPAGDELLAAGPGGRFVHELVVPFVRVAGRQPSVEASPPPRATTVSRTNHVRRHFIPGSEWLFVKFYCGSSAVEPILSTVVAPVVRNAPSLDRWFFIRYADPEWHVRLRLHGQPDTLLREVAPRLLDMADQAVREGLMSRVVLDTYEAEVERYGGPEGVELAERCFCSDSEMLLELLAVAGGAIDEADRWRLALRSAATLLEDLGLSMPQRLTMMDLARANTGRDLRMEEHMRHSLSMKHRLHKQTVSSIIKGGAGTAEADDREDRCFKRRSDRNKRLAAELGELLQGRLLRQNVNAVVVSLVHMALNRMLRWAHLPQELVIYDLLARGYESVLARARQAPGATAR